MQEDPSNRLFEFPNVAGPIVPRPGIFSEPFANGRLKFGPMLARSAFEDRFEQQVQFSRLFRQALA